MSIKFNDVSFVYSPRTPFEYHALKNVNLEIQKGSFTAVVGQTGSGKSTLVQEINGLTLPTTGEVDVEGFIVSKKVKIKRIKELRKKVGMVFQFPEYQLFEDTVENDVSFGPKNFGVKDKESLEVAHKALAKVGLDESYYKRSPFDLSGGQKRRVAIAGIIASEPDVLVLDEPTAGLDPRGTEEMMNLFKAINDEGVTIILVTHDMNLVLKYANDVIVVKDGEIVSHSSPLELFASDTYANYALDMPLVYEMATALNARGLKLNLENIKDVKSLAHEIALQKKVTSNE